MNHLALLSSLAESLHMWVPIPVFNSFSLKMSLMHFLHGTIDVALHRSIALLFAFCLPIFSAFTDHPVA